MAARDMTPIPIDELGRLAVDHAGHLYWDGDLVVTPLSLPGWIKVATVVIAAAMVLNFLWNVGWGLYQPRYPAAGQGRVRAMNWCHGLLRLWIAVSVIWIGVVAFVAYQKVWQPHQIAMSQEQCAEKRRAAGAGNPFGCFDPDIQFDVLVPLGPQLVPYATWAIGLVVGGLLLGLIGTWVVAGFRR